MKFLHTADLHLGKIFYETSLIDDQKDMLEQLHNEIAAAQKKDEPYDALLICGDVYDRAIPAPEAVTLFDNFLTRTHNDFPSLQIIIISGNHDSARRLSFASKLLSSANIHITANTEKIAEPIVINKSAESIAIYSIPFLTPCSINESDAQNEILVHQQALVSAACKTIQNNHKKKFANMPYIICAHLFTQGGTASDSERSIVGTAEQVDASLFDGTTYTALGHLHRVQQPATNVWYAGSPLAYSFDESDSDKYFLSVKIDAKKISEGDEIQKDNAVTVEKIRVNPKHRVIRLEGMFEDFLRDAENKFSEYKNDYIEITCTDTTLIENPMAQLKGNFPFLMSFKQNTIENEFAFSSIEDRKNLIEGENSIDKIFEQFMTDMYNELPEIFDDEKELFIKAATEITDEE